MKAAAEKARNIRPDIVAAAAKIFGLRGYQQATLDEIAFVLGIKKGSLYYHIESKEQLLFAIYLQVFSALEQATMAAVASKTEPAEQLESMVNAIIGVIYDNRDTANVFLHEYRALNDMHMRHRLKDRNSLVVRLEGVMKRVADREGIPVEQYSPRVAAMGILGMCNWLADWLDSATVSRDEVARTFTGMILNGVRRRAEADGTADVTNGLVVKRRARAR